MIDIHCHILPFTDDGAKDMETTMKMLEIAEEKGTKTIIATPHYFAGYYETEYETIKQRIEELNRTIKMQAMETSVSGIETLPGQASVSTISGIDILPGQEICIDDHTVEKFEKGIISTLNETKYILLEFPLDKLPKNAIDTIYELKIRGLSPIIAHPERYLFFIEKPSLINPFIEEGCLFQVNTGSIKGVFGKKVQKTANKYIDNNICNFIASDAHSTGKRCPGIDKDYIDDKLYRIVENNANKLINNEVVENTAQKIQEKRFFNFGRK